MSYAFVFPGQGSQSKGMLAEFADGSYPNFLTPFYQASDRLGYDVWDLIQNGSEEQLNQTEHTQVAMLTADVALFRLFQSLGGPKAALMAGHSLGEYAALVCAEALTLSDAAYLVKRRGELMQAHVPLGEGAMAAIVGLSDEQVKNICLAISSDSFEVTPANYNAIGQVVIAGHSKAIALAIEACEKEGAKLAKTIPVSVPCHCRLLSQAAEAFEEPLANTSFKTPNLPVISNVDLTAYDSPKHIRSLLKQQLYSPVRWVETVQLFKNAYHIDSVIESGPGKILSGLIKRIDKTLPTYNLNHPDSLADTLRRTTDE